MNRLADNTILGLLSPREYDAIAVLAVFPSFNEQLGFEALSDFGLQQPSQFLAELDGIPVWSRASDDWKFIRQPYRDAALNRLNGSAHDVKTRAFSALQRFSATRDDVLVSDRIELELQIARLGSGIAERAAESVEKLRSYYNSSLLSNYQRLEHLVFSYVAENFQFEGAKLSQKREFQDHELSALFMMGMHVYKYGHRQEALALLTPVWKNRVSDSPRALLDAATAAHLIGVQKGKDPNKFSEGVRALKDSLLLGTMAVNEHSVALSEHSLGTLLAKRPNSRRDAEELLKNSLSYEKREGNAIGISKVLHSLGHLYADMPHRQDEASSAYDEALEYAGRTGDQVRDDLIAKVLHSRGSLLLHEGDPGLALKDFTRSLALQKRSAFHAAQVNRSIGLAYEALDDYTNAMKFFERSYKEGIAMGSSRHLKIIAHSILRLVRVKGSQDEVRLWESKLGRYESLPPQ